jgi:hypothetical protein
MSTKPQNNILVGEVVAAFLFSLLLALFDLFRLLNLKRSQSKQAMYCEVHTEASPQPCWRRHGTYMSIHSFIKNLVLSGILFSEKAVFTD